MTVGDDAPAKPAPGRRRARRQEPHEQPREPRQPGDLAPHVPRPSFASRRWRVAVSVLALAVLAGWTVWYATTPAELATSDRTITADGVAGTPLYIGVYGAPDGRTLRLSGVKVHATSSAEMRISPLLCRRGTVGVTTRPEQFCADLVDTEGARMVGGDSIVLRVEADQATIAVIDRVSLGYREDIRFGTQPAGYQQVIVTMNARPDAG
ncbi:hypothetical protein KG112_18095 [Nocardioides sp. zg-ZUI104]|uniref:hypothetical protein n=1 Tax=Nocardioides faecalis TaxID=2803858 RepID=UPI001BD112BA|nr:hypothetical protein [Nocardioides faecalis]MBS4754721.1 hypothetical protein [Nocardioides faecalis]